MAKTINFPLAKKKPVNGPHIVGRFFCGACHHEWEDAEPVGTTHVDCPKCKRAWGAPKNVVEPETHWRCRCGEFLFWLTTAGAMCRRCGVVQKDWAE